MKLARTSRFCAGVVLLALSTLVSATCPLSDSIYVDGRRLAIYRNTEFPRSDEYTTWWRSLPRCSALNQGRAVYRVIDNKIYLTGFSSCSTTNPKPSELYPGMPDQIEATWLSGQIRAYGGSVACYTMCPVYNTMYTLETDKGQLVSVNSAESPGLRDCPRR